MERNPTFPSSSSSSSSSSPPAKTFDVFLSFRGEDNRNKFTAHLSLALRKLGLFNIFKDDYALKKGKDIWPELKNSIKDSRYAVVVLSKNYATSSWCLRELAKIVKCAGNDSLEIRTIFYHVNPSDVRNVKATDKRKQRGSFWEAMEAHQQNPSNSEKTLEKWRNALVTVANQSGYPIEAHTDEAIFTEEFVAMISSELGASIKSIEGQFGMDSRLKDLDSYVLRYSSINNVCFIGIHGMGGIGKSTLAKAYYKRISHRFDGSSFLQNVREVCKKKANGLVHLQKKLLSDILKGNFAEIGHDDFGIDMIRSRLRSKKVLIVLDDVYEDEQLAGLAGEDNWFGSGSIIIVTTREDSFLKIRRYAIYRAMYLNPSEALQLFSWKAFRSIEPPDQEYKELSEQVVKYAGYLPLALIVLGSLLGSKNKTSEWKSALCSLKKCPENKITEKLKISFDDLNEIHQRIFLDIGCFFSRFDKDNVIQILDSCDFDSEYGISNLISKSLLSVEEGMIWMHDLLQEMGKDIVRKESGYELRRQSRIWDTVDLYHILENEKETNEVEAIVTYVDETKKYSFEVLSFMKKLRLLRIEAKVWIKYGGLDECEGLEDDCDELEDDCEGLEDDCDELEDDCDGPELSNNLQYLEWSEFPYNKLPSSFKPHKLVQLVLWNSSIKQLWNNSIKPLYNLKVIDLMCSQSFTKFEDFKVVPNLEKLILSHCTKLSVIDHSIKHLQKLILLDLEYCTNLKKLPEEINSLASLQTLKLLGCYELEKLPDNLEQLKNLRNFETEQLPSSINLMENLESVTCDNEAMIESVIREDIISYCTTGKCFSRAWFCTSLTMLDLSDCNLNAPEAFPEYFGKLVSLRHLDLSKNPLSVLPPGINGLSKLVSLRLEHCESLRCLEAELLPSSLEEVYVNYCTSLGSFLDPSKPCHLKGICSSVFCLDCIELVKRQDGKKTALASLTRFLEDPTNRVRLDFKFVVPQSDYELPSWFINKSLTASISIELDPNWRNSELIGFAMVFCFRASSSTEDKFSCKIRVHSGKNCENWEVGVVESRMSDHLFLLYSRCENTLQCIKQLEPPSCDTLEFSFSCSYHSDCSCGPCGVRLVYEKDIKELKEITSKYYNDHSSNQKDVQSSHSQSISQVSKLKRVGPIGSLLCGGRGGILDLEENLDCVEMQRNTEEDQPNQSTASDIFIPRHDEHSSPSKRVEESPIKKRVFKSKNDWARSRWPHSS